MVSPYVRHLGGGGEGRCNSKGKIPDMLCTISITPQITNENGAFDYKSGITCTFDK